ncbi:hypothetical protein GCM10011608_58640 [Micromonospora sonchi]|uniref:Type I restriction modification DNA specificity domain-containing protein n=1 Tax=Micromonospora sonchi TaxID=1763543 RepID=A0A917UA91_9ACTN|nr:restriction endonuclease subunit S [Micromonospora sonchi]GGM65675.1 hypothetical protein GCM10011608_58640 [Micromonospora sonchi]
MSFAKLIPFADLLSAVVDNRGRTCPTAGSGFPLIATNCVTNDTLYPKLEKLRYVSEETYATWFRGHPKPGDIIFVCKGSPGRVNIAPDPVGFCIAQDMVAVRANAELVYPLYLFAALRSEVVQDQIANLHVGTLIPHFKKGDFGKLMIPVPEPAVQRAIGDLYFLLSQKITVNERISATAAELAEAEYKRIASSTKEVSALGDLMDLKYGRSLPAAQRRPGSVPVYGSGGIGGRHDEALIEGPGIVIGRKGTVGAVYWEQGDFFPIDTTFYVEMRRSGVPLEFAFFALKNLGLSSMNSDSAVPGLNRATALALTVPVPPVEQATQFEQRIKPLFALKQSLLLQSQSVAELRDALLPGLMSGTIRVRDAEKAVEDAT